MLLVVLWREFKRLWYTINLAVVVVEFVELDGLGPIGINILKDRLDFILIEGAIESLHNLLKLFDSQLPTAVSVIGSVYLVQCQFLGGEDFVELDEAALRLELQLARKRALEALLGVERDCFLHVTLLDDLFNVL